MRIKFSFFVIFLVSTVLFSCSKKDDPKPTASSPTYFMTAKVDGVDFKANVSGIVTSNIISLSGGNMASTSINLNLPKDATTGTYELGSFMDGAEYSAGYSDDNGSYRTNDGTGTGSGTLTITEVTINTDGDLIKLVGTFSFTGYNSSAESVVVTDGVVDYKD